MPLNTGDGVAALSSLGMNCKALMPFLMSTLCMCSGVCAGGNCQKWPHHVESARRCSCAGEVSVTAWAHSPTPTCAPAHRFYRTEENYLLPYTPHPRRARACIALHGVGSSRWYSCMWSSKQVARSSRLRPKILSLLVISSSHLRAHRDALR